MLLGVILAVAMSGTPTCWWDGPTLHASGLPEKGFAVTLVPIPTGTLLTSPDGTYEVTLDVAPGTTAYFWQRGGGKGLFHPGAGLNDYKPIATCVSP